MTRDEIIAQAREWLDDEVASYLWSDDALHRYANEALDQACLRTRALIESALPDLCRIELVNGQPDYPLHPAVIVARRVAWHPPDGRSPCPLRRVSWDTMDRQDAGWTTRTGRPEAVVQDVQRRILRLDCIPTRPEQLGELHLTVWRRVLPDERMDDAESVPSVLPDEQHLPLAHWICYRALLRQDVDARDARAAAEHLGQFEMAFGPMPTAAQIRALATDTAGDVAGHWF